RRRHTRSKRDWSSDVCSSVFDFHLCIFIPAYQKTRVIAAYGSDDLLPLQLVDYCTDGLGIARQCFEHQKVAGIIQLDETVHQISAELLQWMEFPVLGHAVYIGTARRRYFYEL